MQVLQRASGVYKVNWPCTMAAGPTTIARTSVRSLPYYPRPATPDPSRDPETRESGTIKRRREGGGGESWIEFTIIADRGKVCRHNKSTIVMKGRGRSTPCDDAKHEKELGNGR